MELISRVLGADYLRDADGRPLREHAAPPELKAGVPMALKVCPYRGSRHKHALPMNVSALSQMMDNWEDVLEAIAYCRALYVKDRAPGPWSFLDMWRVGTWCEALSIYLARRRHDPLAAIPPFAAGLFKVVIGVNATFFEMARHTILAGADAVANPSDVDALLAFIEAENVLVGRQQVCAGPNPHIRTSLEVLARGQDAIPENVRRGLFAGDEIMVGSTGKERASARLVSVTTAGCQISGAPSGFEAGTTIEILVAGFEAEGVVARADGSTLDVMWVRPPPDDVLERSAAGRSQANVLSESKAAKLVGDPSGLCRFAYDFMNYRVMAEMQRIVHDILYADLRGAFLGVVPELAALLHGHAPVEVMMLASLDRASREQALLGAVMPWLSPSVDAADPALSKLMVAAARALGPESEDPSDPILDAWGASMRTPMGVVPARDGTLACARSYLRAEAVYARASSVLKASIAGSLGYEDEAALWGAGGGSYLPRPTDRVRAILGALFSNEIVLPHVMS